MFINPEQDGILSNNKVTVIQKIVYLLGLRKYHIQKSNICLSLESITDSIEIIKYTIS